MKPLVKVELVLGSVSFALIFVCGLAGQVAVRGGMEQAKADLLVHGFILILFCIFGFCALGILLHVFVVLQTAIGNGGVPMIRFLALNETGVTFAAWGFLGVGASIAIPFALYDMGLRMPLRSQGVLTADIGMPIDEVRRGSTLKMKEPLRMHDGARMSVEKMVFEFHIAGSRVRFPQSRYYWLETPPNDAHINVLNIGITPQKMPQPELVKFERAAQAQLFADGWMPGHFVAASDETVRMWGGKRTTGDGRYWLKGNTLLIFEQKRMDDETRDEPAGSGEYIVDVFLRPKDYRRGLVFESSAWTP